MKTLRFLFISASFVLYLNVHCSAVNLHVRNSPSKKHHSAKTQASILVQNEKFTIEPSAKHRIEPDNKSRAAAKLNSSTDSRLFNKNHHSSNAEKDKNGMHSKKQISSHERDKSNQAKRKVSSKSQNLAAGKSSHAIKVDNKKPLHETSSMALDTEKVDHLKTQFQRGLKSKTSANPKNSKNVGSQRNYSEAPLLKTSAKVNNSKIGNHKEQFKGTVHPLKSVRKKKKPVENKPTEVNLNQSTKTTKKSKHKAHPNSKDNKKEASKTVAIRRHAEEHNYKRNFQNIYKKLLDRSHLRQPVTHKKNHQQPHNLAVADMKHHTVASHAGTRKFQKRGFLDQKYDQASIKDSKRASENLLSFNSLLSTSTTESIFPQPQQTSHLEQPHWNKSPEPSLYPVKEVRSPSFNVIQSSSSWPRPFSEAPHLQLPAVQPSNDFSQVKRAQSTSSGIENIFKGSFGAVEPDIQLFSDSALIGLRTFPTLPANPVAIIESEILSDQFASPRREDELPPSDLKPKTSNRDHQAQQPAFAQGENESFQPVAEIGIFQKQSTVVPEANLQSKWSLPSQNEQKFPEQAFGQQSQNIPQKSTPFKRVQNPFEKKLDNQPTGNFPFISTPSGFEQAVKESNNLAHQSRESSPKIAESQSEPGAQKTEWNAAQQNQPVPPKDQLAPEAAQKGVKEESGYDQQSSQQNSPSNVPPGAEMGKEGKSSLPAPDSEKVSHDAAPAQNGQETQRKDLNLKQQNLLDLSEDKLTSEPVQKAFKEESGYNQQSSQQNSPGNVPPRAEWGKEGMSPVPAQGGGKISHGTAPAQNGQESQINDLNLKQQYNGVAPESQPSEMVQNSFETENDKSGGQHPLGKSDGVSEMSKQEPPGNGRLPNPVSAEDRLPDASQINQQRQNYLSSQANQMLSIMSKNLSSVSAVITNQEKPQNAALPKTDQEMIEEQLRVGAEQSRQFMPKSAFLKTEQEILEEQLSAEQPPETDEIEVKFGVTCDNVDLEICWMEREVGDVVTLSIDIDSPYRRNSFQVRWIKMYQLFGEKTARPIELQPGMLPWNMVSGSDNRELRLNPVTNSDLDPNSFVAKVFQLVKQKGRTLYKELKSLTFRIEIPLIDMGKIYAGEELSINIENFISLPERGNMILDWRLETKPHQLEYLPSNAKVSKSGRSVVLKELKKGRLGILTCSVFSSSKFAVAKRRFNLVDIADRDKRQAQNEQIAGQAEELKRSLKCRRLIRRSQQRLIQKLKSSSHHLSRSKRYKRFALNNKLRSLYKECEPWRKEMYSRWIRSLFSEVAATTESHPHPMPVEQLIELSDEGDGTLDDVIPREVHYVKPKVKVLKGTYVETRAAGLAKTHCSSDADCSQNATCQLPKTGESGKSGYCVCLPKFYRDGGTCHKIPEFNRREKRLKRHLEAKQRDLSLEPGLFYANRKGKTRVKTDIPTVEEGTETTPKVLAFEEEESFLLTDCTNDKDCSSHAGCTQSSNGHPYCKCQPGFRGNGIFCWEIMDYVPLEEQIAPKENPISEVSFREQTTLPDATNEHFGSIKFPIEEIDEE